jgi:hypothetical protein
MEGVAFVGGNARSPIMLPLMSGFSRDVAAAVSQLLYPEAITVEWHFS